MYANAFQVFFAGIHHRAVLLKEGYHFDELHVIDDIQPYEFSGQGYPQGGVPVTFSKKDENTMGIDEIQFDRITGEILGCIVLNECGLIAYMPLSAQADDSNVTIKSD